jgi:hypothetical protein
MISSAYTSDVPIQNGFYWYFPACYPVPQVVFLMNTPNRGWCIFASGGYSHGLPWRDCYRSLEPLQAPPPQET